MPFNLVSRAAGALWASHAKHSHQQKSIFVFWLFFFFLFFFQSSNAITYTPSNSYFVRWYLTGWPKTSWLRTHCQLAVHRVLARLLHVLGMSTAMSFEIVFEDLCIKIILFGKRKKKRTLEQMHTLASQVLKNHQSSFLAVNLLYPCISMTLWYMKD